MLSEVVVSYPTNSEYFYRKCFGSLQKHLATPLHLAATHGLVDIAMLLVHHGAHVECRDIDQMTPVHR